MMWVVMMLLPSLVFSTVKAQDVLKLDLEKALEIALSENPTVKVADKEIEKKKYAQKGTYAALFPQINFTADYTRTLKKQVMYMDGFDMGGGSDESTPGMEGIDMSKGIEVGRDNNWTTGFNLSMPLVNATLWKSLSISALDVELSIEQARSSKISMVNQVKKGFYAVLLANDSYRVFKESYEHTRRGYNRVVKGVGKVFFTVRALYSYAQSSCLRVAEVRAGAYLKILLLLRRPRLNIVRLHL